MKNIYILLLAYILIGCKTYKLEDKHIYESQIESYNKSIDSLNGLFISKLGKIPQGNDIILFTGLNTLNKITQHLSFNREDDLQIFIKPTQNFILEEKNVLGINYSNQLNIDTGFVNLNIKQIRFEKSENNRIYGIMELEGKGFISVSGKYIGIPASASPEVHLYLNEPVVFDVFSTDTGYVLIKPEPKQIMLKTKLTIKLLEWKIPWYKEIPVKLEEMIKPFAIPLCFTGDAKLPLPAQKFGSNKLVNQSYLIKFIKTKVYSYNNKIEYKTDINIEEKK